MSFCLMKGCCQTGVTFTLLQKCDLSHSNWRHKLYSWTMVFKANCPFATALVCEDLEGETSHSLLTWPMAMLAPNWRQPFQGCTGGHHNICAKRIFLHMRTVAKRWQIVAEIAWKHSTCVEIGCPKHAFLPLISFCQEAFTNFTVLGRNFLFVNLCPNFVNSYLQTDFRFLN